MPSSYEAEQEQLRREAGIESSSEEALDDEPSPQFPQVNPEIYKDVDSVLFKGFVYVPALIGQTRVTFKSLNHHEFELLRLLSDQQSDLFLAYSVLVFDGHQVLPDRDRWIPSLVKLFESFSAPVRTTCVSQLAEVNRRAKQATELVEAYATETTSRVQWAQFKGLDLSSTAVTGLRGTSQLGLNWGQLAWRAINSYEDIKDASARDWENAKFIASPMAGKGIQKIYNEDKRRRRREQEEQFARKNDIIRHALYGEDPKGQVVRDGQIILQARTVEDLSNQLKQSLKGEKDWHDQIVDNYEKRALEAVDHRDQKLRELQQEAIERFGSSKPLIGDARNLSQKPLSKEQVAAAIERRKQAMIEQMSKGSVMPNLIIDPDQERRQHKWLVEAKKR